MEFAQSLIGMNIGSRRIFSLGGKRRPALKPDNLTACLARFIASGDYTAKHTDRGSRLTSVKGRELLKLMQSNSLKQLSAGDPTHWPSDSNKLTDLVDFSVTKGIPQDFAAAKWCFALFSDHSPTLITIETDAVDQEKETIFSNGHSNLDYFRHLVNGRLTLNIPLNARKTSKQQPSSSTIQFNAQVEMQCRNTDSRNVGPYMSHMV
jgi:hypothetical protein